MNENYQSGLGELFRHLVELTDGSSDSWYKQENLNFRPRYTPIMRVLANGPASVTQIKEKLNITQGAISQTIKLMLTDQLIEKQKGQDARQSIISLTAKGQNLIAQLKPHWKSMFNAVEGLEKEISLPLRDCLNRTITALEKQPFSARVMDARNELSDKRDAPKHNFFDSNGKRYANYRPEYPQKLAEFISSIAKEKSLALDVGCGNGQLTRLLAPYFDAVIGTDPSKSQLENATVIENVRYLQEPAEKISLADNSVDLITVAQAAHWFDLDEFYSQVRRVAKKDAIIALISYGVPYIADPVNSAFQQGYWQDVHEFWTHERAHVETGYANLYFPFEPVGAPSFSYQKHLSIDEFIAYITTWSSYANARAKGKEQKFECFFEALRRVWPADECKDVVWPVSVKIGRLTATDNCQF